MMINEQSSNVAMSINFAGVKVIKLNSCIGQSTFPLANINVMKLTFPIQIPSYQYLMLVWIIPILSNLNMCGSDNMDQNSQSSLFFCIIILFWNDSPIWAQSLIQLLDSNGGIGGGH